MVPGCPGGGGVGGQPDRTPQEDADPLADMIIASLKPADGSSEMFSPRDRQRRECPALLIWINSLFIGRSAPER